MLSSTHRRLRVVAFAFLSLLLVSLAGCSSGLSLMPSGHYLLKRTRELAATAPAVPALHRELNKTVLPDYFLRPGDTLLVEPISYDSPIRLPADQPILADGTVDLGRYGRVVVAGMTLEDAEYIVQDRIEQVEGDVEPINVRMIDPQGAVIYVLGEVNAPGSYPLVGRETVLDAIVAAGGLTGRASPCEIVLTRPTSPRSCRVVLPICYRQITEIGDTTTNYQLMPGDRVTIGSKRMCDDLCFWKSQSGCELCQCHQQCPCPGASGPFEDPPAITHTPESPAITKLPTPLDSDE